MPKKFYTETDIEKLVQQGIRLLEITPDTVLTDLAYEKARSLGIELLNARGIPPAAPVRPYISRDPWAAAAQQEPKRVEMIKEVIAAAVIPADAAVVSQAPAPIVSQALPAANPVVPADSSILAERIRVEVNARLAGKIDPALLDLILRRVLEQVGVK
jgi:hypothetical protein